MVRETRRQPSDELSHHHYSTAPRIVYLIIGELSSWDNFPPPVMR
jgi:hypothetical protein